MPGMGCNSIDRFEACPRTGQQAGGLLYEADSQMEAGRQAFGGQR